MNSLSDGLTHVLFRIIIKVHPMPWRQGEEFGSSVVRDKHGVTVVVFDQPEDAIVLINLAKESLKTQNEK